MVQEQAYHGPATTTVTDYLSTVELVRRELCRHPAGALIDVTVRGLADAIGRGKKAWGAITPALKRLEREGHIIRLVSPQGTLVEVCRSDQHVDRMFRASQSDQHVDRPEEVPPAPIMASRSEETPFVSDQHVDRMFRASQSDQHVDRPEEVPPAPIMASRSEETPFVSDQHVDRMFRASQSDQHVDRSLLYGTDSGWSQQQQQQDARACESEQNDRELPIPPALTSSEWAKIHAAAPDYTESDLLRDLGKLATRGRIGNPIGVIITALRAGEPIYSRQELQERAAALTPPVPEPPGDQPAAPRPERRRRSAPPPDRGIEAPPVSEADLDAAAALEARVRALAPPGTDDEDIGVLITALSSGATDAEALAQMQAERSARSVDSSTEEVLDALREHTRQRARR
jgi:hypothetical protein